MTHMVQEIQDIAFLLALGKNCGQETLNKKASRIHGALCGGLEMRRASSTSNGSRMVPTISLKYSTWVGFDFSSGSFNHLPNPEEPKAYL
jgi:hypothetical protein